MPLCYITAPMSVDHLELPFDSAEDFTSVKPCNSHTDQARTSSGAEEPLNTGMKKKNQFIIGYLYSNLLQHYGMITTM